VLCRAQHSPSFTQECHPSGPSVEALALRPAELKNDRFPNDRPSLAPCPRLLVRFCAGVAATLAWQSYGDAARYIVASLSLSLAG